ncbi:MAG TPA: hypothetical protein VFG29_13935 [Syntrophales bacterium]|nr:hypothetical protein [Syntrophales bacterium]
MIKDDKKRGDGSTVGSGATGEYYSRTSLKSVVTNGNLLCKKASLLFFIGE